MQYFEVPSDSERNSGVSETVEVPLSDSALVLSKGSLCKELEKILLLLGDGVVMCDFLPSLITNLISPD